MAWSGIVGDRLIAAVELRDPKLHIARHLGPGLRFGLGPGAGICDRGHILCGVILSGSGRQHQALETAWKPGKRHKPAD
jgi:hypothetical protein